MDPVLYYLNVGNIELIGAAFRGPDMKTYGQNGFFRPPDIRSDGSATAPEGTADGQTGNGVLFVAKNAGSYDYGPGYSPTGTHPAYIPKHGK